MKARLIALKATLRAETMSIAAITNGRTTLGPSEISYGDSSVGLLDEVAGW
jgi:hypothetical protein